MAHLFRNNLVLGLGGAGGLSVAAFRCALVQGKAEFTAMTQSAGLTPGVLPALTR